MEENARSGSGEPERSACRAGAGTGDGKDLQAAEAIEAKTHAADEEFRFIGSDTFALSLETQAGRREKMQAQTRAVPVRGLEDVIAAETRIGYVDGVNGKLYYAGYEISDLAKHCCYEECVYLLWNDRLPTRKELADFRAELIPEMTLPNPLVQWFKRVPKGVHPMVMLRSAVSDLALYDEETEDNSVAANRRKAIRLVARISAIIAGFHRIYNRKPLVEPNLKKGIAYNFLWMFNGRAPTREEEEAMELMYVLHADHGFNASTFAARVTASTLADIYAAITAAIGALKGPLHGGANQRVMEMLQGIESPDEVDAYIDGLLDRGQRIMGFGHRVYKVEDPRARHLRKYSEKLCAKDPSCSYYEISRRVENKVKKARGIYPNVDFYSATVQHALGIPVEYYTTIFAASRIAGWTAHVIEQHADNRLMRPRSLFIGQLNRKVVPIDRRKGAEAERRRRKGIVRIEAAG
jgi:citrate synthase